jgi:carbon-monoxide dehydrogenase large subunit
MAEFSVVGKSVPRVDAPAKVTGKAKFCADFKLPGMLYAKLLRSPQAHARILRIDTSRAEKLPGVRAVCTGKDVPDKRVGIMVLDQYLIAREMVRYVGEPVAVVAADTPEIAEDALDLIDVKYEELIAVFDVEEAMSPDCPVVLHPDLPHYTRIRSAGTFPPLDPERLNVYSTWRIRQGDVEKGFQEADLIVENRYSVHGYNHCCLEPHVADAWIDDGGELCVRAARRAMWRLRRLISQTFDIPLSKVRTMEPYVGGAFGSKAAPRRDFLAALMALKTGRPVRLLLTREEVFVDTYSSTPTVIYIKDGVKNDGTLVAREMKLIIDSGAYSQHAAYIVRNGGFGSVGTYRIPNFKWAAYGVYTNNFLAGSLRGFGSPAPQFAIEEQMDIIAEKLGMDPVQLRRKNLLREGDRNCMGMETHSIGAEQCLEKVAEWIGWNKKPVAGVGPWKTGKGIALGNKYTTGDTTSCAFVKVHPDRVIEVHHGVDPTGQGINTVLAQVAAEEFGISVDNIKVVWGDTNSSPYDRHSGSSRSTWNVGLALQRACQDAKRQIFEAAAPKLGVNPHDLETKDWRIYAKGFPDKTIQISDLFSPLGFVPTIAAILGKGEYTCPFVPEDSDGQSERVAAYWSHGAHGAEVAVNVETGEVKVLRIVGCFDMGQPINPKMCEQQIDGGIGMGIGGCLYEEIIADNGKILNPNFHDYRIPTTTEIPSGNNIAAFIAGVPHREGPFGAKGLGEGVLCSVAPAICNAFYNATGIRVFDQPLTAERVWRILKESQE